MFRHAARAAARAVTASRPLLSHAPKRVDGTCSMPMRTTAMGFTSTTTAGAPPAADVFDIKSWTPLMHASSVAEAKAALANASTDINFACQHGWTPLIVQSFLNRDAGIVDVLLQHKAINTNAQNNMGATALMLASEEGHTDIVASLLAHADVEINMQDNAGFSALMLAAQSGHADVVNALLQHPSIDVGLQSLDESTALNAACEGNHVDVVRALLAHPAVQRHIESNKVRRAHAALPTAVCQEAIVSWIFSSGEDHLDVVKLLVEHPAIYHGGMPLLVAATTGQMEVVKLLLQQPAIDCNVTDELGISALMLAADGGHANIVERLLQHPDVDCNMQDCQGITALISATMSGHADIVELLALHPATNLDLCEKEHGATALMVACQEGYIDIVEILAPKADKTIKNKDGYTARDFAEAFGHEDIVEVLEA
ncbi:hypothetical protein SPRG_10586 [Saprolegnia parasitica CBS 223.65]|uniref:Uncharacterized protein n=1 Tax=Saprolegnia parasitica (strain CBS 223.65) TaxID=695850 RepID=A0A067C061_SAPPC|nr:hypothetical protein SPRG_10586 [Saprolegnia parasitica CBS 223.65]KDO24159.1 hypothetical protein SPRG_10586 [Saprolegnia parasitica CBS 223.65]|eukprot:XP_012205103.1 hypothetical protein SPRG_10586 [Saprolegnia parasitica CBS 223.65]